MTRIMMRLAFSWSILTSSAASQTPALQDRMQLKRDRTIDLLLADDELTPGRLSLEEGIYRFRVHNAFTSNAIQLRLEDDKRAAIKQDQSRAFAAKGILSETLKPGKYVLIVPQRPKWRVEIEVTAKKR